MQSNYPNNFNRQTNIYSNNFKPGYITNKPNNVDMNNVINIRVIKIVKISIKAN